MEVMDTKGRQSKVTFSFVVLTICTTEAFHPFGMVYVNTDKYSPTETEAKNIPLELQCFAVKHSLCFIKWGSCQCDLKK